MTRAQPREVVQRYLDEVLNGAGLTRPEELIANETFLQKVTAFRAAFPDLAVTTHLLVAEGPFVAIHATGRGTHRAVFQGLPATGRSWAASCSALYRVDNGKIVDFWVNWDLLGILEQLHGVQRVTNASA